MKITFIFSCSGMFRDVPECSGMSRRRPIFIPRSAKQNMSSLGYQNLYLEEWVGVKS